jgi:hypothetical protein
VDYYRRNAEEVNRAAQRNLGEAIRSHYELSLPLPERLNELVAELRRRGDELGKQKQRNSGNETPTSTQDEESNCSPRS